MNSIQKGCGACPEKDPFGSWLAGKAVLGSKQRTTEFVRAANSLSVLDRPKNFRGQHFQLSGASGFWLGKASGSNQGAKRKRGFLGVLGNLYSKVWVWVWVGGNSEGIITINFRIFA